MRVLLLLVTAAAVHAICNTGKTCCHGAGQCINFPDDGNCCLPSESCCSTTRFPTNGGFTCCSDGVNGIGVERCLPTSISTRACQARPVTDPDNDNLCLSGGSPIRGADGATTTCGDAFPESPCWRTTGVWASYCDPTQYPGYTGLIGTCCTLEGEDISSATCSRQENCGDCTRQGCTWAGGEACFSRCPDSRLDCVTDTQQCPIVIAPALLPGTCFRRCGDIGAVRLGIAPQYFPNGATSSVFGRQLGGLGQVNNLFQLQQIEQLRQIELLSQLQQLGALNQVGGLNQLGGYGLLAFGGGYPSGLGGGIAVSPTLYCSCDRYCQFFNDCCGDIQQYCPTPQVGGVPFSVQFAPTTPTPSPTPQPTFPSFPVFG